MLEGKEMDKVVKIKTLKWVEIEQSEMLLNRWGEIQREGNPLWSFVVPTGQALSEDRKRIIEKDLLSKFDCLLTNGQGEPFHLSDHLCADSLFLVIYDKSNDIDYDFPWPLFEETIDEIQTKFEIIYIGDNFNKLSWKVNGKIVGHMDKGVGASDVLAKLVSMADVADQKGQLADYGTWYFQMRMKMTGDEKGADYRPLTSREVEEFLLSNCRSYQRLKQLEARSGESNIELLRELFATGKGQTTHIFQKNYVSQKASNENSKPFACGVEELKGKRIFLDIRPLDMCYDIRLGSLIQLYNTMKESFNLEVISIPFVQPNRSSIRLDVFEEFAGDVPWLVLQNPGVLTRTVKYFLIKECIPDQGYYLWKDELKIIHGSIIIIIEPNGKVFTSPKPVFVLPLLDRWGAKTYPFTMEKIKELEEEERTQMETMSHLEFLFHNQDNISHKVSD